MNKAFLLQEIIVHSAIFRILNSGIKQTPSQSFISKRGKIYPDLRGGGWAYSDLSLLSPLSKAYLSTNYVLHLQSTFIYKKNSWLVKLFLRFKFVLDEIANQTLTLIREIFRENCLPLHTFFTEFNVYVICVKITILNKLA